jgi:hypothetical protein
MSRWRSWVTRAAWQALWPRLKAAAKAAWAAAKQPPEA